MNKTLATAGRKILKDLLAQCTRPQQNLFKRMYSLHGDGTIPSTTDAILLDVNVTVDRMRDEKIDHAIDQCERTVAKNKEKLVPGAYVHYRPDYGNTENGRIKTINENHVFVVYRCNDQWDRYEDYTGQSTPPDKIIPGWVDHNGDEIDTPSKPDVTKAGGQSIQQPNDEQ